MKSLFFRKNRRQFTCQSAKVHKLDEAADVYDKAPAG
jgi:hypothetical protein